MKKTYFILFFAVLSVFSSCKKDEDTQTGNETNSESYLPVTKDTQRTYKTTTGGVSSTYTETFNGNTATYNGLTYYEAVSKEDNGSATSKSYYYAGNGVYKFRTTTYVQGITLEFEYLNENESIGATWIKNVTASGKINEFPARMKGTLKEKNISKEVLGKNYKNVNHATVELQYDYGFGAGFETAATYEFYVAKGVGMILIETSIDMLGLKLTSKTELQSYSVK